MFPIGWLGCAIQDGEIITLMMSIMNGTPSMLTCNLGTPATSACPLKRLRVNCRPLITVMHALANCPLVCALGGNTDQAFALTHYYQFGEIWEQAVAGRFKEFKLH